MSNRRVKYTKQAIAQSLLSLLQEKPLERISITELCERADINRSSFYKHYLDIYDLMEKLEDEQYQKIYDATLKDIHISSDMGSTPSRLRKQALLTIKENPSFFQIFLTDRNNRFLKRLLQSTYSFMNNEYIPLSDREAINPTGLSDFEKESVILYILHGSISVVRCWLENGCKESVDEIDHILSMIGRSVTRLFWIPSKDL